MLPIAPDRMAFSMSRITSKMLGRTFRSTTGSLHQPSWRTAMLTIAGKRPLTIAVSADHRVSATLVCELLDIGRDRVEPPMIDDALRELANMTAGQMVVELGLDQAIGVPRIVDSRNAFGPDWNHYLLESGDLNLVVSLVARIPLEF